MANAKEMSDIIVGAFWLAVIFVLYKTNSVLGKKKGE